MIVAEFIDYNVAKTGLKVYLIRDTQGTYFVPVEEWKIHCLENAYFGTDEAFELLRGGRSVRFTLVKDFREEGEF